jgi:hypothetical protein
MTINGSPASNIRDDDGNTIHVKSFDIGPWNMRADEYKHVATTGIKGQDILFIIVVVNNDAGSFCTCFNGSMQNTAAAISNFQVMWDYDVVPDVTLSQEIKVESLNYDNATINRGKIHIFYVPT